MVSRSPRQKRLLSVVRLRGILLFAVLCAPFGTLAANLDYSIQNWQTEEGLPQNSVNAVLQTHDGYLWLGTFNGLVRFDGTRFKVFDTSNTPELQNSRITSLFEDSHGRLWIGHETGDVTRYEQGHFYSIPPGKDKPGGIILSFGEDREGDIWLMDGKGMLLRLGHGLCFAPPVKTEPAESLIGLVKERGDNLWALRSGELSLVQHGGLSPANPSGQEGLFVKAICASREGGLWILSNGYLRKWAAGQWGTDIRLCPASRRIVTTILETSSGAVAVGTEREGLYLLGPGDSLTQFSRSNGLSHDWVRSLCEDNEGNLWVGTGNGGLNVLRPGKVKPVTPPDHWYGRSVLSVCTSRDGGLWIGTEGAGLYHYHEENWEHYGNNEGLPNLFVWSVLEDRAGHVWLGSWGGGLLERKTNGFAPPPGLENLTARVTALYQDRQGDIWAGTGRGLLQWSDGRTKWYGQEEGALLTDIRAIAQDPQGAIWLGMLGNGLACLDNGVLKQFHKSDGLVSEFIQTLHMGADGVLWIGTFGAGLMREKAGHFAAIGTQQGLPNNVVLSIEDDGQGHFWMSSHGGLFRVSKEELNQCADGKLASMAWLRYGRNEGLPTLECSGGFQPVVGKTPDKRLWFPTRKGLVSLRPDAVQPNPLAPAVLLEEAWVDGRRAQIPTNAASLIIQPGEGRLELHYTGLCFAAPDTVQFKHRLDGLETEWVAAQAKRSVNYSYLPPGDYTFRVTACNNDGLWNETGARLAITVLPHFWQTLWFRLLCGILMTGCVSGVVLLIFRRRMRQKMERLERQQAVERERARIARDIHDDLGASLTRITMLCQSAQDEEEQAAQKTISLDQIYQTARDLTRAMDEIVWAVNPQHDTLDSLATYLGKFAQDFLRPAAIRCRFEIPAQLPALHLTAEYRHNLFLAFKEALNNVVKHSGAREVHISLVLEARAFALVIKDNGRGFVLGQPGDCTLNADRGHSGNGLTNLQRRLEKIHGQCEILSAPGSGTTVRFITKTSV